MEMDPFQDFSGFSDQLIIVKGNRTKRTRHLISNSSVSGGGCGSGSGSGSGSGLISYNSPSLTMCSDDDDDDDRSNETADSTVDDEIMANCLIYLAQSGGCVRQEETGKRLNEVVSNSATKIKAGFFVYECKTCNRTFPSFQALGGHRASHKRPKIMEKEDQKTAIFTTSHKKFDEDEEEFRGKFKRLSDDINISPECEIKLAHKVLVGRNHKANKIHECSFCGSEFSSGQALGGHMRRHRNSSNAKVNNATTIDVRPLLEPEKPRRVFQLDLNLPAPEEDRRDLKFQFPADQQQLVLTASAF